MTCRYNSNNAAIARAKELAEKHGTKTKAYQVQVTDPQRVDDAMNEVVTEFGRLDVVVANAGVALSKGLLEMSLEEVKKVTSVNRTRSPPHPICDRQLRY